MNKYCIYAVVLALLLSCAAFTLYCSSGRNIDEKSFAFNCTHCHGKQLEGINNTRHYCGSCHYSLTPIRPEEISIEDMRETVTSEPHIHKTNNMLSATPSCYWCHRKNEF